MTPKFQQLSVHDVHVHSQQTTLRNATTTPTTMRVSCLQLMMLHHRPLVLHTYGVCVCACVCVRVRAAINLGSWPTQPVRALYNAVACTGKPPAMLCVSRTLYLGGIWQSSAGVKSKADNTCTRLILASYSA